MRNNHCTRCEISSYEIVPSTGAVLLVSHDLVFHEHFNGRNSLLLVSHNLIDERLKVVNLALNDADAASPKLGVFDRHSQVLLHNLLCRHTTWKSRDFRIEGDEVSVPKSFSALPARLNRNFSNIKHCWPTGVAKQGLVAVVKILSLGLLLSVDAECEHVAKGVGEIVEADACKARLMSGSEPFSLPREGVMLTSRLGVLGRRRECIRFEYGCVGVNRHL